MKSSVWRESMWRRTGWFVLLALAVWAGRPLPAAELPGKSLDWTPADAAVYVGSFRGAEETRRLVESRAAQKLWELPAVQQLRAHARAALEDPSGQLYMVGQLLELPENQELLALLKDMFAQETFFWGSQELATLAELGAEINGASRLAPLVEAIERAEGEDDGFEEANPAVVRIRAVLDTLDEGQDQLALPTILWGFALSNAERAQTQLKRLEVLANLGLAQHDDWKERFSRQSIGGTEYLTLELDGEQIPWDRVPWGEFESEPGQYDDLVERLKQLELHVALGVREGFLLLSLGPSNEHLATLGTGPSLRSRAELERLKPYADRKVTSVSYLSQDFMHHVSMNPGDIDELAAAGREALAEADLDDQTRDEITRDLDSVVADVKGLVPPAGAVAAIEFSTDEGYESYGYSFAPQPFLDSTGPLSLVAHLGGNPLLAWTARSRPAPEQFDMLGRWIGLGRKYWEKLGVPRLDETQRADYEQIAKLVFPALDALGATTRGKLLPSLDGQAAFVIDDQLRLPGSKLGLPVDDELPLPEPALVYGVKDEALLRSAAAEYRETLNRLLAGLHEAKPDDVPEIEAPAPQAKTTSAGTLYFYPLPEQSPVTPHAGLSESVAVLAITGDHAERLLSDSTFVAAPAGVLDRAQQQAGQLVTFDWAATIAVAKPWVHVGLQAAATNGLVAGGDTESEEYRSIVSQVDTVLDVLQCLRTISAVTYEETGALVTHTKVVGRDLD